MQPQGEGGVVIFLSLTGQGCEGAVAGAEITLNEDWWIGSRVRLDADPKRQSWILA